MISSDVTFDPDSPAARNCLWCPGRTTAPMRLPPAKRAGRLLPTHETSGFPKGVDVYHWLCQAPRPLSKRAQNLPPCSAAPNGFSDLSKRFLPTSMPTTAIAETLRTGAKKQRIHASKH